MSLNRVARWREKEYSDTGLRCAEDALRYHAELYSTSRVGVGGPMNKIDSTLRMAASQGKSATSGTDVNVDALTWLINAEFSMLENAQTIFISSEIVDEINEASTTMLDNVIIEQDIFTPCGLIVLEKPFLYHHVPVSFETSEGWMVKAIGYSIDEMGGERGISIFLYGNIDYIHHPDGDETAIVYHDRIQIISPKTEIDSIQLLTQKEFNESKMAFFAEMAAGYGRFIDYTRFNFGPQSTEYDDGIMKLKKFLLSYFRLSFEYLEKTKTYAARHARRATSRINMPHDGYIVEMKLRRTENGEKLGGTHSSPAYAFRVRGHWKRAYLPSRRRPVGDPAAYRHIYVKDYIKGRGDVVESRRVLRVEN